jgi:hypothetical protein
VVLANLPHSLISSSGIQTFKMLWRFIMAVLEQLKLPDGWMTLADAAKLAEARPEAVQAYFKLHGWTLKRVGSAVVLLERDVKQYKLVKRG